MKIQEPIKGAMDTLTHGPARNRQRKNTEERRKGNAKELSLLASYEVFMSKKYKGKGKYATNRWEEVPKYKNRE